jgi:hypothetical protein
MATPALNFVAVCANANLPVQGNKNQFLKFLKESGASIGSSQSLPDIKERFAALTWVRHAVANAIDPSSWPSTLSAPLLDYLRTLYRVYPIPPPRSDAPAGETDLHRLANMVSLFIPADLPAASTTSASTSAATFTGGINTTRAPSAQQAPASASTASSASQPAPAVINLTGKKHWLMHDELHALLLDAVYTALDSSAHLPADKRLKLQEGCKKSSTSRVRPVRPYHRRTVRASTPSLPRGRSALRPRQARPSTRHRWSLRRARDCHQWLPLRGHRSPLRAPRVPEPLVLHRG